MAKSIRLYRAHSLVTDPEYGKVCYHWYISHRLYDVGLPYEELIEDYNNIACGEVFYVESLVSEFVTLTAQDGGYFRVYVGETQVSQHRAEREAAEKVTNLSKPSV